MGTASFGYLVLLVIGIILFVIYHKTGKFLKCIFFTAVSGFCALGIIWVLGRFIAMPVSITPLSLTISGILGIPGVISMLIFLLI